MDNTKDKICALVPFFNEEKYIRETVKKIAEHVDLIIAIDDGSTDKSAQNISDLPKVKIFAHEKNYGKGAAIKTGFKKALECNCELLFTIDADLQHKPELMPDFLEKLRATNADIIIGNRLNDLREMPIQRRASNLITSKLLSLKTGYEISDSQSGYRLFKTENLEKLFPRFSGFEAESEIIVKAARNNLKIEFVNIPTIYNDSESKMKSLSAIIGFIKVLFI